MLPFFLPLAIASVTSVLFTPFHEGLVYFAFGHADVANTLARAITGQKQPSFVLSSFGHWKSAPHILIHL